MILQELNNKAEEARMLKEPKQNRQIRDVTKIYNGNMVLPMASG